VVLPGWEKGSEEVGQRIRAENDAVSSQGAEPIVKNGGEKVPTISVPKPQLGSSFDPDQGVIDVRISSPQLDHG
jgi:hypothetical protein